MKLMSLFVKLIQRIMTVLSPIWVRRRRLLRCLSPSPVQLETQSQLNNSLCQLAIATNTPNPRTIKFQSIRRLIFPLLVEIYRRNLSLLQILHRFPPNQPQAEQVPNIQRSTLVLHLAKPTI